VRISVIDDGDPSNTYGGFFTYNEKFQYKWTNNTLHSVMQNVPLGTSKTFTIGNEQVTIRLPAEGAGSTGIMFGDPCAWETGFVIPCGILIGERLPGLLNQILPNVDSWVIVGDMFYDQEGWTSRRFFDQLTTKAKSTPLMTLPGNHDYWILGSPHLGTFLDQFGNGYMQFYGQDVMAGVNDDINFLNFSIAPKDNKLPAPSNFFQYKLIGNLGFITYSGAYTWLEQEKWFSQACGYFASTADVIFVAGHWNDKGDGCQEGMDVPSLWAKISKLPGCDQPGKLKGFMGHEHCNKIINPTNLFMTGATGFLAECKEESGFMYYDTRGGRVQLVLFDFSNSETYAKLVNCLDNGPIGACTQFAKAVWLNETYTSRF
jgi:hypothetical protein